MKRMMLTAFGTMCAALAAHADLYTGDLTSLKHDAVPAHATLTFSGVYSTGETFEETVAGPAAAATLAAPSRATTGWTIRAAADTGYRTPTFKVCPYRYADGVAETDGAVAYTEGSAQAAYPDQASGSKTYGVYVYDIAVSPQTYTVSFSLNGGGSLPDGAASQKDVTYDATYGALPTPTRTGYAFDGWFTASDGGTQVTASTKVSITSSQTLYAHWTANAYSVVFNANGGTGTMAALAMTYDAAASLPANAFTRAHYSFAGWNTAAGGGGAAYADGASVRNLAREAGATATLYAQWAKVSYTITFDAAGGSAVAAITLPFGTAVAAPADPVRDGYTFKGWEPAVPAAMPTENLTVTAQWDEHYKLVYHVITPDDGTVVTNSFAAGSVTNLHAALSRANHTFLGWSPDADARTAAYGAGEMVSASSPLFASGRTAHLYPVWERDSFQISFDRNGGDGTDEAMTNVFAAVGAAATLPSNAFTRTGCAFAGWNTKAEGTGAGYADGAAAVLAAAKGETVTLYAQWTPYEVTFDAAGGAFTNGRSTLTLRYTEGRAYGTFPDVTNAAAVKVFKGWRQARDGVWQTVEADGIVPPLAAGVTNLTAQWVRNAPLANALDAPTLEFATANDYDAASVWGPVADSEAKGRQSLLVQAGAYDDQSRTARITTKLIGSGTLSFRWKIETAQIANDWQGTLEKLRFGKGSEVLAGNFAVGFSADSNRWISVSDFYGNECESGEGRLGWKTQTVEISAPGDEETAVTWDFWYVKDGEDPAWHGRAWLDSVTWTGKGTVPAVPTYTVTFDANGGEGTMPDQAASEDGTELAANAFVREGHAFAGWNTRADGSGVAFADGATLAAADDLTLYAQWTANAYTITFDAAGGTEVAAITQAYGTAVAAPADPARDGYTFAGWVPDVPATMPASNLTVTAQWTADEPAVTNMYTITFDAAGGTEVAAIDQASGTALAAPAYFRRDGYTFAGWVPDVPATMPASNLTVTAQWTADAPAVTNMYTITFDAAGGTEVAAITQAAGTAVAAPADPARDGYTFAGWVPDVPATMPASNLTVTAQWTATGGGGGGGEPGDDDPDPEEEARRLYASVAPALVETAAVYDGCLYDADGNLAGILQVKRARYNARKDLAKVTASVTMVGGRKVSYTGGEWHAASESVTLTSRRDARPLTVVLGTRGLAGTYGTEYTVDGAINPFSSKDAEVKADGAAVLKSIQDKGALTVALPSDIGWSGLSVAIRSRGKVRVTGTLADGTRVSVSGQLLIGEAECCLPVVFVKKQTTLVFALWLSRDGTSPCVADLATAVVGRPGTLATGSSFRLDAAAFSAMWGKSALPYLPDGVAVAQSGKKWVLPKAGKVAYLRGTTDVDEAKLLDNPSALKLTYKAKDGTFKGTFKAYAEVRGRPKATTVNVTGVLVDGKGYGAAVVRRVGGVAVTIHAE